MKHIFISGWSWSHWKDLIDRKIFLWLGEIPIIVRSNQTLCFPWSHAIITPIRVTSKIIENILNLSWDSVQIVNFAWVMATTPNNEFWRVSNIHCLFWPWVTNNLNAIVTKNKNEFSLLIENNLKNAWVNLIELSPDEHDKKMAIIQWLAHFCEILLWIYFRDRDEVVQLLSHWKTSDIVIEDMITLNPYSEKIIKELGFLIADGIELWDIFVSISSNWLNDLDIDTILTPNFKRVYNFFLKYKWFYIDNFNFNMNNLKQMIYFAKN